MDYLAFEISGEDFAVSLLRVREVSIVGPVTRVPGAVPALRGLANLRGSIIPVVDVAVRLGRRRIRISRRTVLIDANARIEGAPTVVGLMVDGLNGILGLSPGEILAPPPGLLASEPDLLLGLASVGDRLVPLLDVDVLVDPSRFRAAVPDPASTKETVARIAVAARENESTLADGAPHAPVAPSAGGRPARAGSAPPQARGVSAEAAGTPPRGDAGRPGATAFAEPTPHRIPSPAPALPASPPPASVLHGRIESRFARDPVARSRSPRTSPVRPPPEPRADTALAAPPTLPSPGPEPTGLTAAEGPGPYRHALDRARAIPPRESRGRAAWLVGTAAAGAVLLLLLTLPRIERRQGEAHPRANPRARGASEAAPAPPTVADPARVHRDSSAVPAGRVEVPSPASTRNAAPVVSRGSVGQPVSSSAGGIHEVRPGDSLWSLSDRYLGNPFLWPMIFAANRGRIEDPDLISPGQRLNLPPPRRHVPLRRLPRSSPEPSGPTSP